MLRSVRKLLFKEASALEIVPKLSVNKATEILQLHYGIEPTQVSHYKSYANQNFKVESVNKQLEEKNSHVLRVRNAVLVKNGKELTSQAHWIQKHLIKNNFNVPKPIKNIWGSTFSQDNIEYSDGGTRDTTLELVEFIKGQTINESEITEKDYLNLCEDIGEYLGKMHHCLANLSPRIDETYQMDNYLFYLQNTSMSRSMVDSVSDKATKKLVLKYLNQFEDGLLPKLNYLRQGFIHGDVSDTNMLIEKKHSGWKIAGLIDFEDNHYGYFISDIGICMAYIMGQALSSNCEPIKAGQMLIQNLESVFPLLRNERVALLDCITARAIVSYVMGRHLYAKSDKNEDSEQFLIQSKVFPTLLSHIDEIGRKEINEVWFFDQI